MRFFILIAFSFLLTFPAFAQKNSAADSENEKNISSAQVKNGTKKTSRQAREKKYEGLKKKYYYSSSQQQRKNRFSNKSISQRKEEKIVSYAEAEEKRIRASVNDPKELREMRLRHVEELKNMKIRQIRELDALKKRQYGERRSLRAKLGTSESAKESDARNDTKKETNETKSFWKKIKFF